MSTICSHIMTVFVTKGLQCSPVKGFFAMFVSVASKVSRIMTKSAFCTYAKTKAQITCTVTALCFRLQKIQPLYFLIAKYQISSPFLSPHSPVRVGPGRKRRRKCLCNESRRNNYVCKIFQFKMYYTENSKIMTNIVDPVSSGSTVFEHLPLL